MRPRVQRASKEGASGRSLSLHVAENCTPFSQRQAGALAARDPDKPRLELCLRAWVGLREV